MNQSVPLPPPAKARRAWLLASLLLSALAAKVAQSTVLPMDEDSDGIFSLNPRRGEQSRPYLQFVGAPPLRFEEAPASPEPPVRVASNASYNAKAPPLPEASSGPARVLSAPAAVSTVKSAAPDASSTNQSTAKVGSPPTDSPPAILPDDAGSRARPEDVLPYFQFPGEGSRLLGTDSVPQGPSGSRPLDTLPPSTATYKER